MPRLAVSSNDAVRSRGPILRTGLDAEVQAPCVVHNEEAPKSGGDG